MWLTDTKASETGAGEASRGAAPESLSNCLESPGFTVCEEGHIRRFVSRGWLGIVF